MEFVLIPAGSFTLDDEVVKKNDFDEVTERYRPKVIVSKPFYLGKYEVTQEQWVAVMGKGSNSAKFKGRSNPVEQVSWDDAQEFISRLNAKEGHNRYRLPTEMEWELAARGGTNTQYFFGSSEGRLGEYAWYKNNSGHTTHPVGRKKPNPYGLYDIYGNVWEWVQDWYADMPMERELRDYRGSGEGSHRVDRGGGWGSGDTACRSGLRRGVTPVGRGDDVGFRLALSPE
jgi:formylglycine-generating enzyme required for sulfatase activity